MKKKKNKEDKSSKSEASKKALENEKALKVLKQKKQELLDKKFGLEEALEKIEQGKEKEAVEKDIEVNKERFKELLELSLHIARLSDEEREAQQMVESVLVPTEKKVSLEEDKSFMPEVKAVSLEKGLEGAPKPDETKSQVSYSLGESGKGGIYESQQKQGIAYDSMNVEKNKGDLSYTAGRDQGNFYDPVTHENLNKDKTEMRDISGNYMAKDNLSREFKRDGRVKQAYDVK